MDWLQVKNANIRYSHVICSFVFVGRIELKFQASNNPGITIMLFASFGRKFYNINFNCQH